MLASAIVSALVAGRRRPLMPGPLGGEAELLVPKEPTIRSRPLLPSLLFATGGLLLFAAVELSVPRLVQRGVDPLLAWFLAGGFGVFLPLLGVGWLLVRSENLGPVSLWSQRLRFRQLSAADRRATGWALGAIFLLTGLAAAALLVTSGPDALHPGFLSGLPLETGRYWLLGAWFIFWCVNILGEEFLWRGVLLPYQEQAHGHRAWAYNGAGWLVFHFCMGSQLVLILPLCLILPYAVQRTQNTTVGIVLHATVNGPGFIASAFGVL